MTGLYEIIEVDATGKILSKKSIDAPTLRVNSDEYIPDGCEKGAEVYIIDLCNAAISDGKGNWYGIYEGRNIVSGKAGQTWAQMFA